MRIGVTLLMALFLAAFVPGAAFAGPSDIDGDGIIDDLDTCPLTPNNPSLCQDPAVPPFPASCDGDGDGIPDVCDNCQFAANADQCDVDEDGFGNICDQDTSNSSADGIINFIDRGAFLSAFGDAGTGGACDDTTWAAPASALSDFNNDGIVNFLDRSAAPFGFNPNFGGFMTDGGPTKGTANPGDCPLGANCRSGMACAVLTPVAGGCPPERGPFAP